MARLYREADMSLEEVLDYIGLSPPETCLDFTDRRTLEMRRARWRRALRILAHTRPDRMYGWLIGTHRPPDRAIAEANRQRNCLLDAMWRAASEPEDFSVELEGRRLRSESRFRRWKRRYRRSEARRRQLRRAATKSDYRSARSQAVIWQRKFRLKTSHFNRVTAEAAARCEFPRGISWKPEVARHRHCWFDVLTARQRERQILTASSAPGTSRHHWGTEFDVFGLDPRAFHDPGPWAEEHDWLRRHALDYGFFQTYHRERSNPEAPGYIAEPWHWSYYPIAQALTQFASSHDEAVDARLDALWSRLERKFNAGEGPDYRFFDYVRHHWRAFVFNISTPDLDEAPAESASPSR